MHFEAFRIFYIWLPVREIITELHFRTGTESNFWGNKRACEAFIPFVLDNHEVLEVRKYHILQQISRAFYSDCFLSGLVIFCCLEEQIDPHPSPEHFS